MKMIKDQLEFHDELIKLIVRRQKTVREVLDLLSKNESYESTQRTEKL